MIGVIADPLDHVVVREFFELFKTPWEFYSADRQYTAVVCAGEFRIVSNATVVIHYSSEKLDREVRRPGKCSGQSKASIIFLYGGNQIPIYGSTTTFPMGSGCFLVDEDTQQCAGYLDKGKESHIVRVGYDLFDEVRTLLTVGQPAVNAAIPTFELHIALLRDIITGCGCSLTEIPPVPVGFKCIACLTHDVDHPSIRRHRWDHTMFGFIYRAVFGSLKRILLGRISARDLLANWSAVLKLPFVYLGFAKDFWRNFDKTYLMLEGGIHSTFFVIPFKGRPGKKTDGPAPAIRGAGYGARDIAESIQKLMSSGSEVGLHGIDAWIDASNGREELEEIRELTGSSEVGVRMHWLYCDQNSPALLETAGAAYDSTSGYNETVGYRAGTTQAFKPLNTTRMLELPLHAMDTALFYPSYLGLSEQDATNRLRQLADAALLYGGAFTINWHDRSLAPERLWGESYRSLIQELKNRGAWFATAGEAVSWFQKRRSASFTANSAGQGGLSVVMAPDHHPDELPALRLRVHPSRPTIAARVRSSEEYLDSPVDSFRGATVASEAAR
jgi:hypothetical protein